MGLQSSHFEGEGAWASRPEGAPNPLPTRHDQGGEQKAHPGPHPAHNGDAEPVRAPRPHPLHRGPPRRPSSHPPRREPGCRGRGSLVRPLGKAPRGDVRRGGPSSSGLGLGRRGAGDGRAEQEGGRTLRPLTPMTTVSSPLNLGMNLSPRRISASLRGRNRHITLMLHSAGSAIAAGGGGEGARGGEGAGIGDEGGGHAPPPAARPPPAAAGELLSRSSPRIRKVGSSRRSLGGRVGAAYRPPGPPAADLPAPAPRRAPAPLPATTRPAAGDAQAARLARLSAAGAPRAQPSRISTSAPARPPPGPPPRASRGQSREAGTRPAQSAGHPGSCSRATRRCKDKDAWSWLSGAAVVPSVQPAKACGSGLAAQAKHRMEVISNTPG